MAAEKPRTIDEYIAGFPPETQKALTEIRELVRQEVPAAEETISYDMPTFNLNGSYLIYFAGWKKHIALYPVTAGIVATLADELAGYKGTKGSIHLPLSKPMPLDLVRRILKLRLEENRSKAG